MSLSKLFSNSIVFFWVSFAFMFVISILPSANGSSYEGNFENNNINGKGIYVFCDKRVYVGDWVNNKIEGHGVFTWPDGRK